MREAPNWLYEPLPYLYVVAGALGASSSELSSTTLLGLTLVLAGLGLLQLRIRHRLKSSRQILFRLGALR